MDRGALFDPQGKIGSGKEPREVEMAVCIGGGTIFLSVYNNPNKEVGLKPH